MTKCHEDWQEDSARRSGHGVVCTCGKTVQMEDWIDLQGPPNPAAFDLLIERLKPSVVPVKRLVLTTNTSSEHWINKKFAIAPTQDISEAMIQSQIDNMDNPLSGPFSHGEPQPTVISPKQLSALEAVAAKYGVTEKEAHTLIHTDYEMCQFYLEELKKH